jgi:phosphoribosylglycinamide formyltransferase-1
MSARKLSFVVLASGTGTNARALIEHAQKFPERFTARALISDREGIPALTMAREKGVPAHVVSHKDESALLDLLKSLEPDWAFLAGYKRLVGQGFLDFFADDQLGARVLNVHPSLLPAYPGLGGYERAFRDGVAESGVTVHLVDRGLDTGKIILQESFARTGADTLESFTAKGQQIEHRLYREALELAAAGKIGRIQV